MSLQKGIVEQLIDGYTLKVRIPKYDKVATDRDGIKTKDLANSIICSQPGMKITYSVGDIVLVDFENNEISKPVILGLLYKANGSNSVLEIPELKDKLSKLDKQLDTLNNSGMYTHIKYSNDNGKTFTSLFDYTAVMKENKDNKVITATKVSVNPKSTKIYWNVINSNNVDITKNLKITTRVYTTKDKKDLFESTETMFEIPVNYRNGEHLYVDFEILDSIDFSTCYISLTTDINEIGTIYGDYIGVCVNSNAYASTNITDYTWTTLIPRASMIISKTTDNLRKRVEENEQALYGYNKSTLNPISDTTGILDAISITLNKIIISKNKDKIEFGIPSNYIDLKQGISHQDESSYGEEFNFKYTNDGHFRLIGKING